jgi:hypothetical protein
MASDHSGCVQAPRNVVPMGVVAFAVAGSVTMQRLFEKHVHPVGQQFVSKAVGSQAP